MGLHTAKDQSRRTLKATTKSQNGYSKHFTQVRRCSLSYLLKKVTPTVGAWAARSTQSHAQAQVRAAPHYLELKSVLCQNSQFTVENQSY